MWNLHKGNCSYGDCTRLSRFPAIMEGPCMTAAAIQNGTRAVFFDAVYARCCIRPAPRHATYSAPSLADTAPWLTMGCFAAGSSNRFSGRNSWIREQAGKPAKRGKRSAGGKSFARLSSRRTIRTRVSSTSGSGDRQPSAWKVDGEVEFVIAELARRGLVLGMASNFDARLAAIVAEMPSLSRLAERGSQSAPWSDGRKPGANEFYREVIRLAGWRTGGNLVHRRRSAKRFRRSAHWRGCTLRAARSQPGD